MADSSPEQPPRAQWYRSLTILVFLRTSSFSNIFLAQPEGGKIWRGSVAQKAGLPTHTGGWKRGTLSRAKLLGHKYSLLRASSLYAARCPAHGPPPPREQRQSRERFRGQQALRPPPNSSEARATAVGDMEAAVPSRVALSAASRFPNRHAVAGAPPPSLLVLGFCLCGCWMWF
jgi:hypothetical protein